MKSIRGDLNSLIHVILEELDLFPIARSVHGKRGAESPKLPLNEPLRRFNSLESGLQCCH